MTATLRGFGLTHVQFVLLASLWWLTAVAAERPSQRRLADFAGTEPMMTSQVLRTLEGKALLTRESHPADARARQLGVSRRGAELARRALAAVEAADRSFFKPANGRKTLIDFLRMLAA
jgi:DNA-binding MarR family transcriptional regulator